MYRFSQIQLVTHWMRSLHSLLSFSTRFCLCYLPKSPYWCSFHLCSPISFSSFTLLSSFSPWHCLFASMLLFLSGFHISGTLCCQVWSKKHFTSGVTLCVIIIYPIFWYFHKWSVKHILFNWTAFISIDMLLFQSTLHCKNISATLSVAYGLTFYIVFSSQSANMTTTHHTFFLLHPLRLPLGFSLSCCVSAILCSSRPALPWVRW